MLIYYYNPKLYLLDSDYYILHYTLEQKAYAHPPPRDDGHHGPWKAEVELFGTMRHLATLTLLLCLWVSYYVLGSFCPSLEPVPTVNQKGQNSCRDPHFPRPQNPKSQEFKVEIYSSSSIY